MGEEGGEQRARNRRRAGRGTRALHYFGQGADLDQSGQAKSPQKRKHCGGRGVESPQRALRALPTPRHRAASLPRRRRSPIRAAIAESAFAARNHCRAAALPCPECRRTAAVRALRGPFRRQPGTSKGRRRDQGGLRAGPGAPAALPRGAAAELPSPANPGPPFSALSNHSRPFNLGAVPAISARSVAARLLSLAPLPRAPEAPLPPPLWEPAEPYHPCCRSLGRRWGREGRAGASRSGAGWDFCQGNGLTAGSGRTRTLQWRRRERRVRGARGGREAVARRARIGGAGAASGCDWLAGPALRYK